MKLPKEFKISIEAIVYGLAKTYRWGAAYPRSRISVLDHSVRVSKMAYCGVLSHRMRVLGLLHDASEAYIQDIPCTYKKFLPDYMKMEAMMMRRIYKFFNIKPPTKKEKLLLKYHDHMSAAIEESLLQKAPDSGNILDETKSLVYAFTLLTGVLKNET